MRTLVLESPELPLFSTFSSPHKATVCQEGDQLVARAKASRPQLWRRDRFEGLQLDGRIGAYVHLCRLQVGVTEPQRDFAQILRGFQYRQGATVSPIS